MKLGKSESAVGTASRNARRKTPEMRRLFGTYDADNDGRISSGELDSIMKKLGLEISEDELNGMVRSVDKNGDGYVDFDEFLDFQESLSADNKNGSGAGGDSEAHESSQHGNAGADDDELREAFDVFDKNKDGFISVKELHSVLRSLGISAGLTITNCEKMILAVDSNGDGQVDFLEFKDLMAADNLLP
jgi:calcium-binding protein CML